MGHKQFSFTKPSTPFIAHAIPASAIIARPKRHVVVFDSDEMEEDVKRAKSIFSNVDLQVINSKETLLMTVKQVDIVDKGYLLIGDCLVLVYDRNLLFNRKFDSNDAMPVSNDTVLVTGYTTLHIDYTIYNTVYITNTNCISIQNSKIINN